MCSRSYTTYNALHVLKCYPIRSGAESTGYDGGTCPPTFTNGWARGTRSRRTANKEMTKPYWPSRKQLIVLVEPKQLEGHDIKKIPALCTGRVPPTPTFKFVPAPPPIRDTQRGVHQTTVFLLPVSKTRK